MSDKPNHQHVIMDEKSEVENIAKSNNATKGLLNGVNKRKPQHSKLSSHSAPNTSFIKSQTMDNQMMGDEDINSNPAKAIPESIKRTGNSLEVSIDVEDDNTWDKCSRPKQEEALIVPRTTMGIDQDRANRIDVLWRVAEGVETDASISNCLIIPDQQLVTFQQNKSRIIPQFQQIRPQKTLGAVDELGQAGSQAGGINDPNENVVLLGKKSEDDQGDRPRNGGLYNMEPNIEPQPKLRREPLTWPWHSGSYQMNFRFHTPQFRTIFSSKVILMKALQWLVATVWTYIAYNLDYFRNHQVDLAWSFYFATFFLMSTFLTVRSTSFIDNQTSFVVLLIYTVCIAHLSAMLHIHYDCSIIPIVLLTMTTTYILSAATFTCIRLDVDSSLVYYPIFVYVVLTSIIAFWFVIALGKTTTTIHNPLGKMVTIWFPCCLVAMIVSSLEMLEIQALLRGTRTPLEPNDWVLATTFLL